jgi:hypothetical protein
VKDITELLARWNKGDQDALSEFMPLAPGCFSIRLTTGNPQYGAPTVTFPIALRDR